MKLQYGYIIQSRLYIHRINVYLIITPKFYYENLYFDFRVYFTNLYS